MINRVLNHLEEWLVTFLMGAATLIIFVSVAHRYLAGVEIPGLQDWLLSLNFSWAQELCIIMFVWMAKFGAAYGVRTGIHVGVDVLINRLDDAKRGKFIVFGLLAGALFTGIGRLPWAPSSSGKTAPTTPFSARWALPAKSCSKGRSRPTWSGRPGSSTAPFRSAPRLMCFRFLQVTLGFLRTGELPHHDHGHVDGLEMRKAAARRCQRLWHGRQPAHARPEARPTGRAAQRRRAPWRTGRCGRGAAPG